MTAQSQNIITVHYIIYITTCKHKPYTCTYTMAVYSNRILSYGTSYHHYQRGSFHPRYQCMMLYIPVFFDGKRVPYIVVSSLTRITYITTYLIERGGWEGGEGEGRAKEGEGEGGRRGERRERGEGGRGEGRGI